MTANLTTRRAEHRPDATFDDRRTRLSLIAHILREFAERDGNKLIGLWGVQESDLDFVILTEGDMPPATSAALSLGQRSMGHIEVLHMYTLVETEDVDATLKASNTVTRAPGEA